MQLIFNLLYHGSCSVPRKWQFSFSSRVSVHPLGSSPIPGPYFIYFYISTSVSVVKVNRVLTAPLSDLSSSSVASSNEGFCLFFPALYLNICHVLLYIIIHTLFLFQNGPREQKVSMISYFMIDQAKNR